MNLLYKMLKWDFKVIKHNKQFIVYWSEQYLLDSFLYVISELNLYLGPRTVSTIYKSGRKL